MKFVFLFILIVLALVSLTLPIQGFEIHWAHFDFLPKRILESEDYLGPYQARYGYEITLAIVVTSLIVFGTLLSALGDLLAIRIIGLVLCSIALLLTVWLYLYLAAPLDPLPAGSLSNQYNAKVEYGYFLLFSSVLGGLIFSSIVLRRINK